MMHLHVGGPRHHVAAQTFRSTAVIGSTCFHGPRRRELQPAIEEGQRCLTTLRPHGSFGRLCTFFVATMTRMRMMIMRTTANNAFDQQLFSALFVGLLLQGTPRASRLSPFLCPGRFCVRRPVSESRIPPAPHHAKIVRGTDSAIRSESVGWWAGCLKNSTRPGGTSDYAGC